MKESTALRIASEVLRAYFADPNGFGDRYWKTHGSAKYIKGNNILDS